ncbi:MAG: helix-turn-helix domain-containing protein [Chloroflexota bacterium]
MKFGKYRALFEYLSTCSQDEVTLRLTEIEDLLREPLPISARRRRDWWGNRRQALQAAAWVEAGYKVTETDLERGEITFTRPPRRYSIRRDGDIVLWDGSLIKALREHMGMNQARFAEALGMRQQTISEWETGAYAPSKANCKYLMLVAEQAGFFAEKALDEDGYQANESES